MNTTSLFAARRTVLGALATGLVAVAAGLASAQDVDCSMCHDSAPVPRSHMPVDEVSVQSCGMCHESSGKDLYFRAVHEKHGEALGCETCHSDASAESAARLKSLLGQ
jgi:hypothetical protein